MIIKNGCETIVLNASFFEKNNYNGRRGPEKKAEDELQKGENGYGKSE